MVDESSHSDKSVKGMLQRVINSLVGDASVRLPNPLAMLQRTHPESSSEHVARQTVKVTVALSDKQIASLQQQHTGVVIQKDVLTGMTTISGASSVMHVVMRELKALPDSPQIVSHITAHDVVSIPTLKEIISSFVHGFTKHITGQSATSAFASRLVDAPISHGSSFVAQQSLKITDVHEDVESLSKKIQAAQDGQEPSASSSVVLSSAADIGIDHHVGAVVPVPARSVVGDDTLPQVSAPVVKPPVVPVDKPTDKPEEKPIDTVPDTPVILPIRTGGGGSAQTSVVIESDVQPLSYTEDGTLPLAGMRVVVQHASTQVVTVSVVLSDVDAGLLSTATSSGVSGQPAITSSFDSSTGTWSATGNIAEVNELLGSITFTPEANYEDAVTLSVHAQSGTSSGTYGFQVTAVSANDAPTDISVSASSVNENISVGTVVATLSGVDADSGDVLTYSFAPSGNVDGKFSISGNQLLVAAGLNYEAATSHAITVRATDSAGAFYDEIFTVSVLNVNEAPNAPIDSNAASNTVVENAVNGTVVGVTASATDPDAGASVVYSLSNDAGGRFAIDANTGVVTVANSSLLNYESASSHTITVLASDGALSTSTSMSIGVNDAAEAPTDIMISNGSVNENSALSTLIGTLSASDDDAGSSFTYAIASDPDSKFLLSGSQLLLNGLVNYEVKSAHNVTIRVTDNTGRSYSEVVSIAVNNMNDAPILGNQTFTIAENSTNGSQATRSSGVAPLHAVSGYDEDGNSLTYNIVSGNTGGAFAINSSTGEISVANSSVINYEATPSYVLEVQANDGSVSSSGYITVNLTNVNEAPAPITDANAAANTIAENASIGAVVGITASAADPEGSAVTYALSNDAGGKFAINATTGVVTLAGTLDYETTNSHTIVVSATDGTLTSTQSMTVNVTDVNDAPVYNDRTLTIAENTGNGNTVGTASATDADGNALTYTILSGNSDGLFAINASTGVLSIDDNTNLDHELTASRVLTIEASDGTTSDTATVTVTIADVNEAPDLVDQSMSVADSSISVNGDVVGTIHANDPESGQTVTYAILSGNELGAFALDSTTGIVTVANAALLSLGSAFSLSIQSTDNGAGALHDTAIITVNVDNTADAPVLADATYTLDENSANGTSVATLVATDADGNAISYAITSGNNDGIFTINANTGVLSVTNNTLLNYEHDAQYDLVITATDNSAAHLSDTAAITVNIQDINEDPVLNDATVSLAENTANGSVVTTLAATDVDAGQSLTYSIVSGNDAGAFAINAATGAVSVANSALLNYETTTSFNLGISVADNGLGTLTDNASLTINLTNVNEAPVNGVTTASFAANEDTAIDITGLSVSDVDSTNLSATISVAHGTLTLRNDVVGGLSSGQISGNGTSTLTISATTQAILNATLAAAAALTYTPTAHYNGSDTLSMVVSDGALTDSDAISISLASINDAPVVANAVPVQSLESNTTWNYTFAANTFTDVEGDALTYSVSYSSNDGASFTAGVPSFMTFNAATRTFNVGSAPGNGNVDSYMLRVTASDGSATVSHDITLNVIAVGLAYTDATARTMSGTSGADVMSAGSGNDTMYGGDAADTMYGGAGNDSIKPDETSSNSGYYCNDVVYGGAGNDIIYGDYNFTPTTWNNGHDTLYGDDGNDSIYGYNGNDLIYGGDGNDSLDGSVGADTIYGGLGLDTIYGGTFNDVLDGGTDADYIVGGDGADTITTGTGVDTVVYESITESANNSVFDVITDFDVAFDVIRLPIFNMITNGTGVASGRGLEWYQSGSGATAKTIIRSDGITLPFYVELTGHKNLTASNFAFFGTMGSSANDTITGTAAVDAIMSLAGNDVISAGAGNDQVWSGDDNDSLDGSTGNDLLYGEAGNDTLVGSTGSDYLNGGDGNDVLISENNAQFHQYYDTMVGGLGADMFKFTFMSSSNNMGYALIQDFEVGIDKIDLQGLPVSGMYIGGLNTARPFDLYVTYDSASNQTIIRSTNEYLWGGTNTRIYLSGNHATNVDTSQNVTTSDFIFGYVTDNNVSDADARVGYIRESSSGKEGIVGTSGNDTIYAGIGGDEINSGAGNDVIVYRTSSVVDVGLNYGTGYDRVFLLNNAQVGTVRVNTMYGTEGVLAVASVGALHNVIIGSHGNDTIFAGASNNGASGNNGNDLLYLGRGGDMWTTSGIGNDTIYGGEGNENQWLPGNAGDDVLIGGYGQDYLYGGDAGVYTGSGSDNFIWYDPLEGRSAERDVVFDFNAANDKIVLYGFTGIGAGATELTVTQYSATQYGIPGGSWTDIAASNAGIDFRITLLGTHTFTVGTSLILNAGTVGTSAADAMTGTASDEFIFGELGNDTIDGGDGNDSLFGSDGNDSVLGGNGNDSLSGGYNNDILIGGAGIDTMEGGSGADTFTFVYGDSSTTNTDVIWDFKEGVDADKIDLSSATLDAIAPGGTLDYSDLVIETPDILGGMYTRVSISGSDFAIYLIGYYESGYTLSATDFIF